MAKLLTEWLDELERAGELVRIHREVDPKFEASALIEKIQKSSNKAIVFEKIRGYSFPLVSNLFGTYQRTARILGCQLNELNQTWNSKEKVMSSYHTVDVEKSEEKYVECAIHDIPTLIYREKDAGAYISAGMVMAKDPESGIRNLSFHRMQVVNDHKLHIRITPGNHLGLCYEKAERMGKPLEVAVLIGGNPALMLAAASRIPAEQDELMLAGALMNESVRLRPCQTVDLQVPVGIDWVIEGAVLPHVREEEGPFGDFMGYYVPVMKNLVLEVRQVFRLEKPCAYGILAGSAEQDVLAGVPVAARIYEKVKEAVPSLVDAACLPKLYHSVVKIDQQFPGQAKQAALAALACDPSQTKFCTVVDRDVDIHDPMDVQWATITRCRPDKDIFIIPDIPSFRRDPHQMFWGKMGICAVKPLMAESRFEFERTRIPGADEIDLDEYLK